MKIAMLFPGYGSQFVGMAKELYDDSRLMQEYFEEASNCLPINFVKLCFASSESELRKIDNAYVSLFLVSSAIGNMLVQEGIKPDVVVGYQIGNYSAACVAGSLSLPDGLYFLAKYAQFYQEFLTTLDLNAYWIEGISYAALQKMCDALSTKKHGVVVSVCRSDDTFMVVGQQVLLDKLENKLHETHEKIKVSEGTPHVGLYSTLADPLLEQLRSYLEKIDFHDATIPLISTLDGILIQKKEAIKHTLVDGLALTMRWDKVMHAFASCDLIIEVGPGTTLSKWAKTLYSEKNIIAVNKTADILEVRKILAESSGKVEKNTSDV